MEEGEMQEVLVRKVGVLSVAIFSAIVGFFIGLFQGIFLMVVNSTVSSMFPIVNQYAGNYISWISYAWILFPLSHLILGFVFGGIFAFIYNISAKVFKGVKLYS